MNKRNTNFTGFGLTEDLLFEGLSASADNVYLFKADLDRSYAIWSENAIEYFGLPDGFEYNATELWIEHVHPDDRQPYIDDIMDVFEGKKDRHYFQYRATNAEGEYVWLECIGHIVEAPNEHKFFVGIITRLDATGKYDSITNCLSFQQFYTTAINIPSSLLLLGLDSFRKIVNSIGYSKSNKILFNLGEILRSHFGQANVFRMTGDEFLIFCPQQSNEELSYIFQNIQQEFKARCSADNFHISLGFSGGGCSFYPGTDTKEEAIKHLEHALEYSKQQGTEHFTMFSSAIEESHLRYTKLKYALSNAISQDFKGFSLVYQPIIRSSNHKIDGFESLLRFHDPGLGNVSPLEFISILEESGEIQQVGLWVAETAIRQKSKWDKIHPGLLVGFNVSLKQLQSEDFTNRLIELLDTYHIEPAELVVELTESCKMHDPVYLSKILTPLKERGILILLDDFGMEQSSFSMVKTLPINGIKIDHSFVRTMLDENTAQADLTNKAIVSSINLMGQMLNLRIVAEGVETEAIDQLMCEMNIQLLQGYYYSTPISATQVEAKWL